MENLFNKLSMEPSPLGVEINHWGGETLLGNKWDVRLGDSFQILQQLPDDEYHCVVTSPPYYWQRNYDVDGQYGMENSIQGYVDIMLKVMGEVKRVMRKDGVLFLNLGDTYYSAKGQPKGNDRKNSARRMGLRAVDASGLGVPRKTAIGIPWRVALAMIGDGWVLRSPIIWRREGVLPEFSSKDRPWRTYETVFLFSKSPKYFFDRSHLDGDEDVWTISDRRHTGGIHNAAFPESLVQKCLNVGCPISGKVLDPFVGSGTVLKVALQSGRDATGIDLNEKYCKYIISNLRKL